MTRRTTRAAAQRSARCCSRRLRSPSPPRMRATSLSRCHPWRRSNRPSWRRCSWMRVPSWPMPRPPSTRPPRGAASRLSPARSPPPRPRSPSALTSSSTSAMTRSWTMCPPRPRWPCTSSTQAPPPRAARPCSRRPWPPLRGPRATAGSPISASIGGSSTTRRMARMGCIGAGMSAGVWACRRCARLCARPPWDAARSPTCRATSLSSIWATTPCSPSIG